MTSLNPNRLTRFYVVTTAASDRRPDGTVGGGHVTVVEPDLPMSALRARPSREGSVDDAALVDRVARSHALARRNRYLVDDGYELSKGLNEVKGA